MTLKDPTNELCRCGHLQSDHYSADHSMVRFSGACKICKERCIKYSFTSWALDGKEVNVFPGNKEVARKWK